MAQRPPRRPTRLSSPYVVSQTNGRQAADHQFEKEQANQSDGVWSEPSQQPIQPSFMDYRGLERAGVLEGMQPLGTMPPSKMVAKSRQESSRRSTHHARAVESLDASEATPVSYDSPVPANVLAISQVADENMNSPSPAGDLYLLENFARNEEPMSTTTAPAVPLSPFAPMSMDMDPDHTLADLLAAQSTLPHGTAYMEMPTSTGYTSASHVTIARGSPAILGSPAQTGSPYQKAIALAARNGDTQTEQMLYQIHLQAPRDPELAELLNMLVCTPVTYDERVALDRKIRAFKRRAHAEIHSPLGLGAAIVKPAISRADTQMPQSSLKTKGPTIDPATAFDHLIDPALTQTMVTSAQTPSLTSNIKPRISLHYNPAPHINGGTSDAPSPLMEQSGNRTAMSPRRSSSSSLSSVDESLLQESNSTAAETKLSAANLKRSAADANAQLEREEYEATSKRLKVNHDGIEILESAVRPKLADRMSRASTQSSAITTGRASGLFGTQPAALGPLTPSLELLPRPITPISNVPGTRLRPAARVKTSPIKDKKAVVVAGVLRPDQGRAGSVGPEGNLEEGAINQDICSACGGAGYLLCCDGCPRSFHFTCLDPPIDQSAAVDEPWFCYICEEKRSPIPKPSDGLFAALIYHVLKKTPTSFCLPESVRDYFEGVQTGEDGEYVEIPMQKAIAKTRVGYDGQPDYQRLLDSKGNTILCFTCGKSALGHRNILSCDYCDLNFHLDCLDPPLSNPPRGGTDPKFRNAWMCPNHVEHDLRYIEPVQQSGTSRFKPRRVRRPKNAKVVDTYSKRGYINNGLIEVGSDSEDDFDFDEVEDDSFVARLPARGIKLDFIDKAKSTRIANQQTAEFMLIHEQLRNARQDGENAKLLNAALKRRNIQERKTAFNLTQLAFPNSSLNLGLTDIEKLINALEAEASPDVIAKIAAADSYKNSMMVPPSPPPSSDQIESTNSPEAEREMLLKLHKLIQQRLDGLPATTK